MTRKMKEWELADEVPAVLDCSPNLVPCKKFSHASIYRFADHMKNDKCQLCIAWNRQAGRELKTMKRLAEEREKSRRRHPK